MASATATEADLQDNHVWLFSTSGRGCFGPAFTLDDLEIATCAWVSWFNEERIHGELDDLTPAEVEADYIDHTQVNAA